MNAKDIIFYGNRDVLSTFGKVPADKWDITGVCGIWTAKDVLAHLTSYERILDEVIKSMHDETVSTPHVDKIKKSYSDFNKEQVAARKNKLPKKILEEYSKANASIMKQIENMPKEMFLKIGVVPWYGKEYCLDDFIVYMNYAHKKEHLTQVNIFVENLSNRE